jgi:protein-tyrosine phosphatase
MISILHWVATEPPRQVAVMPRPRGGDGLEDEIRALRDEGVQVVVSLVETAEVERLGLADEGPCCTRMGLEFLSHPIEDMGVPRSDDETVRFIHDLAGRVRAGRRVAIHCFAGIGRSGVVAGGVLVGLGLDLIDALERLREARGIPMPQTPEQYRWLRTFAERHL